MFWPSAIANEPSNGKNESEEGMSESKHLTISGLEVHVISIFTQPMGIEVRSTS